MGPQQGHNSNTILAQIQPPLPFRKSVIHFAYNFVPSSAAILLFYWLYIRGSS